MNSHTGKKLFECGVCQKRFARSDGLKQHLQVHTKEKPHMCEYCGKLFTQKHNVKRHLDLGRCPGKLVHEIQTKSDVELVLKEEEVVLSESGIKSSFEDECFKNFPNAIVSDLNFGENEFQVLEVITNEDGSEEVKVLKLDPANDVEFINVLRNLSGGSKGGDVMDVPEVAVS